MNKNILLCAFLMLTTVFAATAQTSAYDKYYVNLPVDIKKVEPFSIPDLTVNITDFGGVGDGITLNTEAFSKAMNALQKQGGGHIIVPAGVWLTGPIAFKDNIDLHVEKNAIIQFSPDKEQYVDPSGKSSRVLACIRASKRKNISITGEGIIDGNGAQWRPVKRSKVSDTEWKQFLEMGGTLSDDGSLWYAYNLKGRKDIDPDMKKQEGMRNDLVRFTNCENVLIEGVTFQNAPKFHVHPCNSRNIIIDGITVRCPWNAQNGDAIDLSDCHQTLIVNCTVDAGDDGICMKSGKAKKGAPANGCEDILIEGNTVFHGHGAFVIGSESMTSMERIVVRNCRFSETDNGLRFKSGIGRGGKTGNIFISNIVMTDIKDDAIVIQCDYENKHAGREGDGEAMKKQAQYVPEFTGIHISDVVCRGADNAITAKGIEGMKCVYGISVKNSTFVYNKKGDNIDKATADVLIENVKMVPMISE